MPELAPATRPPYAPPTPVRRRRVRPARSYPCFLDALDRLLTQSQIAHTLPVAGATDAATSPALVAGRVEDFVDDHLDRDDLRLDDLADAAGLSPSHFSRVFKRETGTSPWRYVIEARVDRAKTLLQDPTRSLADVAFATGFYDQPHFTRTFKRIEGVTPGTFRDNALQNAN